MKTPSIIALLVHVAIITLPVEAQNFTETLAAGEAPLSPALPEATKAEGKPEDPAPLYQMQGVSTLAFREKTRGSIPVSNALRDEVTTGEQLSLLSATYRELAKPSAGNDCPEIALAVRQRLESDPASLLENVDAEVKASPACACEIVKAAIQEAGTDTETVVGIVETAITASPENMRLISQCAVASAPETLSAIQALLARLDPNAGETTSAKSGKSAKDEVEAVRQDSGTEIQPNPLDRTLHLHVFPPPINPPVVSRINP